MTFQQRIDQLEQQASRLTADMRLHLQEKATEHQHDGDKLRAIAAAGQGGGINLATGLMALRRAADLLDAL